MRPILRPKHLPFLILTCSILGFVLRLWALGGGPDAEGLYTTRPIPWLLFWVVTVPTLALTGWTASTLKTPGSFSDNFPVSLSHAIGSAVAVLGIALSAISQLAARADRLSGICGVVGILAAIAMAVVAYSRVRGNKPFFLCHIAVCLYLALVIFERCKAWGNEPQFGVFLVPFLALVFVMLAAYHLATFDVDLGDRRKSFFWSLGAAYFCIVSLADRTNMVFFGCMAIWLLTNLCSPRHLKPQEQPLPTDTDETQELPDEAQI